MGASDRDWNRSDFNRQNRGIQAWSATKWLIILNIFIFILGFFAKQSPQGLNALQTAGAYSVTSVLDEGQWWRLISYQFIHANLGHLLFNMVALFFFGNALENVLGKNRYLIFYLICGIAGALFSSILASAGVFDRGTYFELWRYTQMVGASGAIFGLLAAIAVLFPHSRVQLIFPPVELSMRTLALCLLGLSVLIIGTDWTNAGGEAGHLGGMIMGFILIKLPWWRPRGFQRLR